MKPFYLRKPHRTGTAPCRVIDIARTVGTVNRGTAADSQSVSAADADNGGELRGLTEERGFSMIAHGKDIQVFAGNSNKVLAEEICAQMHMELGGADVGQFSDGEIHVSIFDTVRGSDVFVVQSTCSPVNRHLMELLVMIDALRRASAGRITAVIPYFGYARQDRKAQPRDPITAKLVSNMITAAGADRVLTMDLHASQIQGFFDIPVDNLAGRPIFQDYYKQKFSPLELSEMVVVSPDVGSVSRARYFAENLHTSLAIVDKRRPKANESMVMNLIGEVKDRDCILVDDLVDTAGSLCHAAEALKQFGAKRVWACASHGVLSGPALERISASPIQELALLNTIPAADPALCGKLRYLSVAPMFAEALDLIFREGSFSELEQRMHRDMRVPISQTEGHGEFDPL